jgi:hypothetical protein
MLNPIESKLMNVANELEDYYNEQYKKFKTVGIVDTDINMKKIQLNLFKLAIKKIISNEPLDENCYKIRAKMVSIILKSLNNKHSL